MLRWRGRAVPARTSRRSVRHRSLEPRLRRLWAFDPAARLHHAIVERRSHHRKPFFPFVALPAPGAAGTSRRRPGVVFLDRLRTERSLSDATAPPSLAQTCSARAGRLALRRIARRRDGRRRDRNDRFQGAADDPLASAPRATRPRRRRDGAGFAPRRRRRSQQQATTAMQPLFPAAIGQQTVVTHLHEALGQDVLHEATQELLRRQRLLGPVGGVVLVRNVTRPLRATSWSCSGRRGVPRQVLQHLRRTAEGRLPLTTHSLLANGRSRRREGRRPGPRRQTTGKTQLRPGANCAAGRRRNFAPEHPAQHAAPAGRGRAGIAAVARRRGRRRRRIDRPPPVTTPWTCG